MRLNRLLYFTVVIFITLMSSGCSKTEDSDSFVGTWDIDTSSFLIVYDEQVSSTHPEAIIYLRDNKSKILEKIMKPEQIVFDASSVSFIYTSYEPDQIYTGTYTTYEIYATIYNRQFSSGITAACNSRKMELYYNKEYMMSILENMLTANDPDKAVFENLIDSFDGVGVYYKAE
jgi:tryptophanyl-tRNA synthetase